MRSFDQENPLFQFELGGENEIHNYRIGCPPDPAVSHDNLEIVDSSCFGRTLTLRLWLAVHQGGAWCSGGEPSQRASSAAKDEGTSDLLLRTAVAAGALSERHGAQALHYSPSVTLCVMGASAGPELGFAQLALRAVADDKAPRPADLGTPRQHSRQPGRLRTCRPSPERCGLLRLQARASRRTKRCRRREPTPCGSSGAAATQPAACSRLGFTH